VKLVCYLAMVVTGVGLLTNRGQFLYILGGVEAILPASGAVTAWDLLIRTGPLPDGPR
jgi:hypothetical protein